MLVFSTVVAVVTIREGTFHWILLLVSRVVSIHVAIVSGVVVGVALSSLVIVTAIVVATVIRITLARFVDRVSSIVEHLLLWVVWGSVRGHSLVVSTRRGRLVIRAWSWWLVVWWSRWGWLCVWAVCWSTILRACCVVWGWSVRPVHPSVVTCIVVEVGSRVELHSHSVQRRRGTDRVSSTTGHPSRWGHGAQWRRGEDGAWQILCNYTSQMPEVINCQEIAIAYLQE